MKLAPIYNTNVYQTLASRTAKDMGTKDLNLIHAAMGLASDAGEFVDAIKKHTIYGKPLDYNNAVEELGDVLWFVALACDTLGISMGCVMRENIDKLTKRYPEKYTDTAAIARADKKEDSASTVDPVFSADFPRTDGEP
jgi:NTP pyrophosphatase (non-canonical NTP hydrolase)